MERAGVPRSVAMKLTGHKTDSVYRRYAIVSDAELRGASQRLTGTFSGTSGSIAVDSRQEVSIIRESGRIAQGESTCLTSRGSEVRNLLRPPLNRLKTNIIVIGNRGRSSLRRLAYLPQEYVSAGSERAQLPRIGRQHVHAVLRHGPVLLSSHATQIRDVKM
jgi:hypothetical protein